MAGSARFGVGKETTVGLHLSVLPVVRLEEDERAEVTATAGPRAEELLGGLSLGGGAVDDQPFGDICGVGIGISFGTGI